MGRKILSKCKIPNYQKENPHFCFLIKQKQGFLKRKLSIVNCPLSILNFQLSTFKFKFSIYKFQLMPAIRLRPVVSGAL
jgi:hypothetical protein